MSGFSADWLALREASDARARSTGLLAFLPTGYRAVVDLGAGTGANLRWLAPRLDSPQHWTLVDNDAKLLAAVPALLRDWAVARGYRAGSRGDGFVYSGPGLDCSVELRELDLAAGLDTLGLPDGCLLTASALFDLVGRDWLEALVAGVAASGACVLWALSYDGSIELEPGSHDDAAMVALLNRHQSTDKGFGPALGPEAWQTAQTLLENAGLTVWTEASRWQLGAGDAALACELIDGWAAAAVAMAPADPAPILAWRQLRLDQATTGRLEMAVGHRDLAARPRLAGDRHRPG